MGKLLMIVKDLLDLHYNIPFVIDGISYDDILGMPKMVQDSIIDKIDVRQDPTDGFYKAFIDIYKVEDPI